jgi:DNA-binding transcriptional LysR family regulator
MNIEAIQIFVETVQRGSFTAVARARGVAPSSVSRVIAELEADLEVRLFQRTTRRLSLTEAGQGYLDRVAPLLEELQRAREHARDLGSAPKGLLRVAVAGSFAQLHLSRWLARFLATYPDLSVELLLDARYSDLVSERIDVAIRLGRVESSSVIVKKLCDMPRVIVASPKLLAGRSLTPEALEREPCLLFPHQGFSPVWKLRDRKGKVTEIELEPRARVVAADGVVLRALALEGEGFALLARWICAEELATGTLVDAFPRHDATATEFDAAVSLIYASRSYLPLKVRVFVDFISELFRGGPPWERSIR